MKQSQLREYISALSKHQEEYLEKYKSLKTYINNRLPEISDLTELDSLRQHVKKDQRALERMYEEMAKIQKILKDASKQSTKVKQTFEKFNLKFTAGFKDASPDCKPLFEQIAAKKQEIKDGNDPVQMLKKLISKFKANELDLQAFNDFLMNPAVKSKVRMNPLFAAKVENLNKQIIGRYAQTIATIDQELFLTIRKAELFSPWAYAKSPTIIANTTQYNNLADYVSNLVLAAPSIEERAIILDRWIWVAHYLFEELKDYSGCHAILTGLSRNEVSRLKRTFDSLSEETQDTFQKLSAAILVSNSLRPIFNAQQAVIPAMPLLQRDVTFVHDGNKAVTDLENKEEKREEMVMRTGGGRKIMLTFTKLQSERGNFSIPGDTDAHLDGLLRDRLKNPATPYDPAIADDLSKQLEPTGNELKAAKPIKFGKVFKSSSGNNQPCMRQVMLEELIQALTQYLVNDPSGFLKQRNQESFQMDNNYVIDWEKENKELEKLSREMEAHVEVLKGYSTKEKNSSLLNRANGLISKIEALDFKQLKMQNLESKLYVRLYKLKVEFANVSRYSRDPDAEQIGKIIAEVEKISKLSESCQFSPNFLKHLEAFNQEITAFKQLANPSEVQMENGHVELEKPLPSAHLRCRFSLLYAPLRQDLGMDKDLTPTLSTVVSCA
ncbi:RasGEF domain-containing protein [Legionella micdadei]|uniref:RasGEF domain-containing protein n=1 Tax=Legionella micdadei TaxID=451 RepID=A0A098GE54_LEGMI|nr:RasGEF domain-containing protein [Legionella micdadei]ARG97675.1 hypothetical protein B6N58_08365 [Legionella micdadei]ARH00011.1 hypothetical protein B6V88_06050 [Legionella micdadei]KTD27765.1 RasGEF domain protein [Legionella micdadei]CEG60748.1 protein of unknown function [Ras guanine nucleotide exchange factor][coiled-coil domain] [Legionella micdadei]SCY11998.1 RasGEF domain-containing protein [Legionella micdadei]